MEIKIIDEKKGYATISNTDLTEGRGSEIVVCISDNEITAKRMGESRYIQGGDCPIEEVTLIKLNLDGRQRWYGPIKLQPSTDSDMKKAEMLKRKKIAIEKIKSLGMPEEEIKQLLKDSQYV